MAEGAGPRILVTNDDGHHSTGIGILERIARTLSDDVWVVAPEAEQSATSHSLTIHRPLRLRELADRRYAVDGTPTDCVLIAINHILADHRPDLVLSGVNHGQNVAEDVTYSGTIAAAMEATLLGVRAIAFSQELPDDGPTDWETALAWGPRVARRAMAVDWPRHVLVNVNFPALAPDAIKGVRVVPHGNRKLGDALDRRLDPRGKAYFWIGSVHMGGENAEATDGHALEHGYIPVTPLHLDLSHYPMIDRLSQAFQAEAGA